MCGPEDAECIREKKDIITTEFQMSFFVMPNSSRLWIIFNEFDVLWWNATYPDAPSLGLFIIFFISVSSAGSTYSEKFKFSGRNRLCETLLLGI